MAFAARLNALKAELRPDFMWYPFGTLGNLIHLDGLLGGGLEPLLATIGGQDVLDIAAADGDLAFFLESLGARVDVVDHAPTNSNGMRGVTMLAEALASNVRVEDVDLDSQFRLPRERYGLAFMLGVLYHLKNPFYALETLARRAERCVLNTRVARFVPQIAAPLGDAPVAYLLGDTESYNDPTNFWVFTSAGLRRLLHRTGWDVEMYASVGDTATSDPADPKRDERAFCLLRSRHFAPHRNGGT